MTYEECIQAMIDDPGDEPSSEDLPDYVDPRKEVSPHDADASPRNPYYGEDGWFE